jgi:hypothetical protein
MMDPLERRRSFFATPQEEDNGSDARETTNYSTDDAAYCATRKAAVWIPSGGDGKLGGEGTPELLLPDEDALAVVDVNDWRAARLML